MRPQLVSIICLFGIIGAAGSVVFAFSADELTFGYRAWMLLMAGIQIKAIQGVWNMKKWGVVLYAVKFALVQVALMVGGFWSVTHLAFPVLILLGLSQYYSDMR